MTEMAGTTAISSASGGAQAGFGAAVTALQAAAPVVKERVGAALARRRPWTELADRSAFSRPATVGEAITRARKNASYFGVNYGVVTAGSVALGLVLNPSSLVWMALLAIAWVWVFMVRGEAPLVVNGHEVTPQQKLYGMGALSALFIFFFTGVGSTLITSAFVGAAICAGHGAMRAPDDLFLDDAEAPGQPSLMDVLTGKVRARAGAPSSRAGSNALARTCGLGGPECVGRARARASA